jgi:uncharacterized protein (TIGR02391 family)
MAIPSLADQTLKNLSEVLTGGVTQAQLTQIFNECHIDPASDAPQHSPARHSRIYRSLRERQQRDGCANTVVAFIIAVVKPSRFLHDSDQFESLRVSVNRALAFEGLHINEAGEAVRVAQAQTLREAEERAGRLRAELKHRQVHADVLECCRSEFLEENYFHTILEATKSVAKKIRDRTGLTLDGVALVNTAFNPDTPFLVWSTLYSDTEKSEHRGTMELLRGVFSSFRNLTAHKPKITHIYTEQDALDLLTLVSFLHRRVDAAQRTFQI